MTSRLYLEHFPAYAPELNPDEGVWSLTKRVFLVVVIRRTLIDPATALTPPVHANSLSLHAKSARTAGAKYTPCWTRERDSRTTHARESARLHAMKT